MCRLAQLLLAFKSIVQFVNSIAFNWHLFLNFTRVVIIKRATICLANDFLGLRVRRIVSSIQPITIGFDEFSIFAGFFVLLRYLTVVHWVIVSQGSRILYLAHIARDSILALLLKEGLQVLIVPVVVIVNGTILVNLICVVFFDWWWAIIILLVSCQFVYTRRLYVAVLIFIILLLHVCQDLIIWRPGHLSFLLVQNSRLAFAKRP